MPILIKFVLYGMGRFLVSWSGRGSTGPLGLLCPASSLNMTSLSTLVTDLFPKSTLSCNVSISSTSITHYRGRWATIWSIRGSVQCQFVKTKRFFFSTLAVDLCSISSDCFHSRDAGTTGAVGASVPHAFFIHNFLGAVRVQTMGATRAQKT
jgi:hypothetical protein